MIFLLIFAALIAIVLILLFSPLHVRFRFTDKPRISFRLLFVSMDADRAKRLFSRKKSAKREDEKKPLKEKKKAKGSVLDFIDFLLLITKIASKSAKRLFDKMKIKIRSFSLVVGTDDAAKTALYCGAAIQGANSLFAVLQRFSHLKWDDRKLIIAPDYTSEVSRIAFDTELIVRPIHLIGIALDAYITYQEGKDRKHVRNSAETSHRLDTRKPEKSH